MTLALEHPSVGSHSAQILPSGEGMLESLYTTVISGLLRVRRRAWGVARVLLHFIAVKTALYKHRW